MSVEVTWTGLDELREALRKLPEELTAEATDIVDSAAEIAMASIIQAYPHRTGDLRSHVVKEAKAAGPFGVAFVVKNTSRHAWIFENGTQARHTAIGANRGAMPPGRVVIPTAVRCRQTMYRELKDMVTRHGLVVSGDA
jgi:Bacteriophage HK97-gp10, putative tail-component